MSKVNYLGGRKVKGKESELSIEQTFTDVNANDLMDANNDNDTRIAVLEAGGSTESIQAYAEWLSGFTYEVNADRFPVENTFYSATQDNLTSDPADLTLDRIDILGAYKPIAPATVGTVGIIKGTPATAGIVSPPDYDASMFYPIKLVLIKAAATVPDDVSNVLVYDEDAGEPTEYTTTSSSVNIVTDSINDPHTGAVSIESTNQIEGDKVLFVTNDMINTTNLSLITLWLKLKSAMSGEFIWLRFYDEDGALIGSYNFNHGSNGFDQTNLEYQKISIEGSKLGLQEMNIKSWDFYIFANLTGSGFFLDTIQFHKGSGNDNTNPAPTLPIIFRGKRMEIGDGLQLDLGIADTFTRNPLVNAANDFVMINLPTGFETQTATMYLTGEQPWTLAQATKLFGEYDGSVLNQIVIEVVNGDTEQIYYTINPLTI